MLTMKKLAYVTSDYFIDVDIPIVTELNKHYELLWIVHIKTGPGQRFSIKEVADFAKQESIQVIIKEITTRYRHPKQMLMDVRTIFKLRKFKADICYFQTFFNPYLPLLARLLLKVKTIVVGIHDVVPHKNFRSLLSRINDMLYLRMFKNYHFYSETQKSYYEQHYKKRNILMARLFLKDYGPAKNVLQRNKINFLFFGVIQYYKGLDYLIEAANLLSKEFENFKITVAGKCDDFERYRKLIEKPDLFDLSIKTIPNQEIPDLFANADFLVLPYRDVTQSGPLLIAYNYNIPVIASNFAGFREYIQDGKTGYLFEPGNPNALFEVMKKTLLLPKPELETLKENIRLFVQQEISIEGIVNKYISFFEKL
jgi:Glycosyltransferase